METRSKWWSTLISLAMAACGAATVYVTVFQRRPGDTIGGSDIWSLIIPVLMLFVGLTSLVVDLKRQPEDTTPSKFSLMLSPYSLAWRKLWSSKWLIAIYGIIAVIAVAGSISDSAVTVAYKSHYQIGDTASQPSFADLISSEWLGVIIRQSLPHWSQGAMQQFIPRVGLFNTSVFLSAALVLSLIWIMPRLRRLAHDPDYSRKAGFFGFCAVIVAVGSAIMSAISICFRARLLSSLSSPTRSPIPDVPQLYGLAHAIIYAVITAAMVGGILGSLARSRKSEPITGDTFLADAVRHFEALAGFYLALGLLPALLTLATSTNSRPSIWPALILTPISILAVALMYAPYAIASQRTSFFESVQPSLTMWKDTALQTLSLIAAGAFFFILNRAVLTIATTFASPSTWWYIAPILLYTLAGILLQAIIILAVWEFYSQQTPEETRVPVQSL